MIESYLCTLISKLRELTTVHGWSAPVTIHNAYRPPEPGSSTLYLSTSVLKYKFQSTWKVLKYISEKYHVLVLELKYILKVLRFSSTFQVHFKYFRLFYRIIFQTTKLGDWGKRFICS